MEREPWVVVGKPNNTTQKNLKRLTMYDKVWLGYTIQLHRTTITNPILCQHMENSKINLKILVLTISIALGPIC